MRGRSFAPKGKTPVLPTVGGTRQKLSMIATVTNQGKTRWMIIDEAFNADKLIEFLLREAANEHMQMLQNNPQRVISYFQDPRVRYAA